MAKQKIIPHLWFDTNAFDAVKFYTAVFKGSVGDTTHYTEAGFEVHGMKAGTVLTIDFDIEGMDFIALNGGPIFKFTPAISFMVNCPTVAEVDELWAKLADGGTPLMPLDKYPFSEKYGWIQDKFGVSWQISVVPDAKRQIVPSLLYTGEVFGRAEEAMKFYVSLFENSKIGNVSYYDALQPPNKEGTVMYADFTLAGQKFAVMDSPPIHKFNFNEAVSFLVVCEDQREIDYFWEKFEVPSGEGQCGWLKDKFGVSWQITAEGMTEMLNDSDKEKANRAMEAMLQMRKIDIKKLKDAYEGK